LLRYMQSILAESTLAGRKSGYQTNLHLYVFGLVVAGGSMTLREEMLAQDLGYCHELLYA
jgi:hypothetical protein